MGHDNLAYPPHDMRSLGMSTTLPLHVRPACVRREEMSPDRRDLLLLADIGVDDVSRAGQKAATLGALRAAGFPVPDGAVLTTDAFDRALGSAGLHAEADPAEVLTMALTSELTDALATIQAHLGAGPYAVRSSAVDEDGDDRSFAGLYTTVLNVPPTELSDAVRRCWSSAFTTYVRGYAPRRDADRPRLAVLVQPMIPAHAAGVAFGADPVTGDRDAVLVSAVHGLADRLVGGHVTPDEWLVRGNEVIPRSVSDQAIDARTVGSIAALCRQVEGDLGAPQDIEWAIVDQHLMLLQARPVTALPPPPPPPIPVPIKVPGGYWRREASHSPKPWTPMFRSVFAATRIRALGAMFTTFGLPADTMQFREIGGWYYLRMRPFGGRIASRRAAAAIPLLLKIAPPLRRRVRAILASLQDDVAGQLIERWYHSWQPDLNARAAAIGAVDLANLDDSELAQHTGHALELVESGCEVHYMLHGALGVILADLVFTCRELLGWTDAEAFDMLSGLSTMSTEPAHRLNQIAQSARERPRTAALLARAADHPSAALTELRSTDPQTADAIDAYIEDYGHRTLRYELADPTIAETPALTLRLLRDQLTGGYDPDQVRASLASHRAQTIAEARTTLSKRRPADRPRFERALERAERAYPVREDNEAITFSAPMARLRYALLECGRRLAGRRKLAHRDDIFYLTVHEVLTAMTDSSTTDLRALVDRRHGEHRWVQQHPGPSSYGTQPPQPPHIAGLPPQLQFALDVLTWTADQIFAVRDIGNRPHATAHTLTGLAASPGRFTGPVRLIHDEHEFHRLRPGDVLVCPITSPVWSILFPNLGALITDTGGLLSHPAIIAREYHLPAVVATTNATTTLHDGQLVTVDGTAGHVEIHR